MMRMSFAVPLVLLAGCSPGEPQVPDKTGGGPGAAQPAPQATETAVPTRVSAYTSLEHCEVVRKDRAEMPYTETQCAGPAGWALRIADADARQTLTVRHPGGRESRLDTARIGGGGFSSFGETAEWRGPAGPKFAPDALIVRYQVAEQPHPAPDTAYLLAIKLTPEPCIIARIAPGAEQNAQARAAADRGGPCLAD